MSSTPYIAKPIDNARDAIASHLRWKITLLLAASMREPLSERATRSIHHPEDCTFRSGCSPGTPCTSAPPPSTRRVYDLHLAFHAVMRRIADLINAGDFPQAESLLNAPSPSRAPPTPSPTPSWRSTGANHPGCDRRKYAVDP